MSSETNNGSRKNASVFEFQLLNNSKFDGSEGFVDLGTTPLARQLDLKPEQTNGHWCSCCQGIWFGYTLEAECPVCGNRHG